MSWYDQHYIFYAYSYKTSKLRKSQKCTYKTLNVSTIMTGVCKENAVLLTKTNVRIVL